MSSDLTTTIPTTALLLVSPVQKLSAAHFHGAVAAVTTDFGTGLAENVATTGFIRNEQFYV